MSYAIANPQTSKVPPPVARAVTARTCWTMRETSVFQLHRPEGGAQGASNVATFFNDVYDCGIAGGAAAESRVDPLRRKLEELQLLQTGWDGRGADAPSGVAVESARSVLQLAREAGRGPDRLAADVEGGVAVYFFGGDIAADGGHSRQAGILIDNSGEAYVYQRQRGKKDVRRQEVASTAEALRGVISEIITFLRD